MRLIDADALLKLFVVTESGRRIPEVDIDNFPNTVSIKEIKDIIRHQPTAYDVDKVVKELEKCISKSLDACDFGISRATYEKALRIVKEG